MIIDAGIAALQRRTLSVVEYARSVIVADGERKGTPYDPTLHQAQRILLEAIDSGYGSVTIVKPVQDGGSLASFIPILRRAHALSQTVLIAYPTMDAAKDAWSTKVWPMLEAQGGTVPTSGGGSRGGAARVTKLPGGGQVVLRAAGGRGESGQASVTADALMLDEVDDWPDLRRVRLIERRIAKAPDPLAVYVSTVKRDGAEGEDRSLILRLYDEGTRTRLHYECPHCQRLTPLDWDRVNIDACAIACAECACLITESQRLAMLRTAQRVDLAPGAVEFSILWTALDSPFPVVISGKRMPVLAGLIEEYRKAVAATESNNPDHGYLRQFYRDRLCQRYIRKDEDDRTDLVESILMEAARTSDYQRGIVPEWASRLYFTADIQLRRHYLLAVATDGENRWAIVDWWRDAICGDMEQPTRQQRLDGLERMDQLTRNGLPKASGEIVPAILCGIDTGFHPEEIRPWVASKAGRWLSCKGAGTELARRMVSAPTGASIKREEGWYDLRQQDDAPDRRQLFVDADPALDRIAAAWRIGRNGTGETVAHLPVDAVSESKEIIRHLTGMQPGKVGEKVKWKPRGARHDYLDCLVYGLAIAKFRSNRPTAPQRKYGAIKSL